MRFFPTTVIDDFFDYPDYVADLARNVKYSEPQLQWYPGRASVKKIHEIDKELYSYILDKIISVFWDTKYHTVHLDARMDFQKIEPYSDTNSILNTGSIHADTDALSLAGIVYLNRNPEKDMGTSIYNLKKEHQFYCAPREYTEALQRHNSGMFIPDMERLYKDHCDKYEETMKVQNKYNRLVLYSPELWHSATSYGTRGTRYTLRFFISYLSSSDRNYPLVRRASK